MTTFKSLADFQQEQGTQQNHYQKKFRLDDFKRNNAIQGDFFEFFEARLPFSPPLKTPAFHQRADDNRRHQIEAENKGKSPASTSNSIPVRAWLK
jgi:hypothetical protein